MEEEDESEEGSFKDSDSVLRDKEMQQAYGDWVGSQVNVTALGSLDHFKNLRTS